VSAGRGGSGPPDSRPGAAIRPRRAYRRGVSDAGVFGPYRGGTYTRAYLTMFWLLSAAAIALELWAHGRWGAIVVLVVVAAMGATVLVGTAQSVLSPEGLRLVLLRRWVPWTEVAEVPPRASPRRWARACVRSWTGSSSASPGPYPGPACPA
jgi:hypothetical protein